MIYRNSLRRIAFSRLFHSLHDPLQVLYLCLTSICKPLLLMDPTFSLNTNLNLYYLTSRNSRSSYTFSPQINARMYYIPYQNRAPGKTLLAMFYEKLRLLSSISYVCGPEDEDELKVKTWNMMDSLARNNNDYKFHTVPLRLHNTASSWGNFYYSLVKIEE